MENQANTKDAKRDRFVRIAERRVNQVLDALDRLQNCSDRHNYTYDDSDVKRMFGEIEKSLREVKQAFTTVTESRTRFSLQK